VQHILKYRPSPNFLVISGDDQTTLGAIAYGGDGVISVISNAYPHEWSTMVRAALEGDYAKARNFNDMLQDIHPFLYCEGNPVGIKAACSVLGFCENNFRLPLVPMSAGNFEKLKIEMEKVGLLQVF
jgi:4-hydroxy-tetrahydrodipicolinate synthase